MKMKIYLIFLKKFCYIFLFKKKTFERMHLKFENTEEKNNYFI